jgi:hypothetical protein
MSYEKGPLTGPFCTQPKLTWSARTHSVETMPDSDLCCAALFHGGIRMSNADPLPSLLFTINQNPLTLEAAIMELMLRVEQRGSAEVAGNFRGALDTISKNEEFINMTLAVLMMPE